MMRALALVLALMVAMALGQFDGKHFVNVFERTDASKLYRGAMSDDGDVQIAILKFDDGTPTKIIEKKNGQWAEDQNSPSDNYKDVAVSPSGTVRYAVSSTKLYVITELSGGVWAEVTGIDAVKPADDNYLFNTVATNGDVTLVGSLYLYERTGAGWKRVTDPAVTGSNSWYEVFVSGDGSVQLAITYAAGPFFERQGASSEWTTVSIDGTWRSLAVSDDGSVQLASQAGAGGQLYERNAGVWTAVTDGVIASHTAGWVSVAVSADGIVRVAVPFVYSNVVYTKSGSDTEWTQVSVLAEGTPQMSWVKFHIISSDGSTQILGTTVPDILDDNLNTIMELVATDSPTPNPTSDEPTPMPTDPTLEPTPMPTVEPTPQPTFVWSDQFTAPATFTDLAISNSGETLVAVTKYRLYEDSYSSGQWSENSYPSLQLDTSGETYFTSVAMDDTNSPSSLTIAQHKGVILEYSPTSASWEATTTGEKNWKSVVVSDDGSIKLAVTETELYSKISGGDWTQVSLTESGITVINDIAISADGSRRTIVGKYIYEWDPNTQQFVMAAGAINDAEEDWKAVAVSPDGSHQTVVRWYKIWEKHGDGEWVEINDADPNVKWNAIDMSYSGASQIAVGDNGGVYTKVGDGQWTQDTDMVNLENPSVQMSDSGIVQVVCGFVNNENRIFEFFDGDGFVDYEEPTISGKGPYIGIDSVFQSLAISGTNGQYQTAVDDNGFIYTSSNSGDSWTRHDVLESSSGVGNDMVVMSDDGKYQLATFLEGGAWLSSDYGDTWTKLSPDPMVDYDFYIAAMSYDGALQIVSSASSLFVSEDQGGTWTEDQVLVDLSSLHLIRSVAVSSNGLVRTLVTDSAILYYDGDAWIVAHELVDPDIFFDKVAMSGDGNVQIAIVLEPTPTGTVYKSIDAGRTWAQLAVGSANAPFSDVSLSYTGQFQTIVEHNYVGYHSNDYGEKWSESTTAVPFTVMAYVAMTNDATLQVFASTTWSTQTFTVGSRPGSAPESPSISTSNPTPAPTDPTPGVEPQPTFEPTPQPTPQPTPNPTVGVTDKSTAATTLASTASTPSASTPSASTSTAAPPAVAAAGDPWLSRTTQTVTGMLLGGLTAGGTIYVASMSSN